MPKCLAGEQRPTPKGLRNGMCATPKPVIPNLETNTLYSFVQSTAWKHQKVAAL